MSYYILIYYVISTCNNIFRHIYNVNNKKKRAVGYLHKRSPLLNGYYLCSSTFIHCSTKERSAVLVLSVLTFYSINIIVIIYLCILYMQWDYEVWTALCRWWTYTFLSYIINIRLLPETYQLPVLIYAE